MKIAKRNVKNSQMKGFGYNVTTLGFLLFYLIR